MKIEFEEDFKAYVAWNHSTLFLIKPIVGLGLGQLVINFGLINSFLEDEENNDYREGDFLFVLLHPSNIDVLEVLIAQQESDNLNFIGEYDYPEGHVVLVYTIPPHLIEDFNKFKQGRYSEFSEKFKSLHDFNIVRAGKKEKSFQYMVMFKDEEFRKDMEEYLMNPVDHNSELWSAPSLSDKEILKINNYVTTYKALPPANSIGESENKNEFV